MAKKAEKSIRDELKKELEKLKKAKKQLEKKNSAKTKKVEKKDKEKTKKVEKKDKAKTKKVEKKEKVKKLTKAELKIKEEEEAKRKAEAERTYEEELQEQLSEDEIENFVIAKLDMNKLIGKVCEILLNKEKDGVLQTDLWRKLKLNSRDGSRLSLKMEKMGYITRQKILKKGRWTYTLFIEKAPISFESIVNSPCLTCVVEQKCSLENELPEPSPRNCELIENWVLEQYSRKRIKK